MVLIKFSGAPLLCGGGQGGENLPLPVPRSPASRTFLFLCLPTPALYCVPTQNTLSFQQLIIHPNPIQTGLFFCLVRPGVSLRGPPQ